MKNTRQTAHVNLHNITISTLVCAKGDAYPLLRSHQIHCAPLDSTDKIVARSFERIAWVIPAITHLSLGITRNNQINMAIVGRRKISSKVMVWLVVSLVRFKAILAFFSVFLVYLVAFGFFRKSFTREPGCPLQSDSIFHTIPAAHSVLPSIGTLGGGRIIHAEKLVIFGPQRNFIAVSKNPALRLSTKLAHNYGINTLRFALVTVKPPDGLDNICIIIAGKPTAAITPLERRLCAPSRILKSLHVAHLWHGRIKRNARARTTILHI